MNSPAVLRAEEVLASPMLAAYLYARSYRPSGERQVFDPWHNGFVAATPTEVSQMISWGAMNRAGFDRRRFESDFPDLKQAYDNWEMNEQAKFDQAEATRRAQKADAATRPPVWNWGKKKGQPMGGGR